MLTEQQRNALINAMTGDGASVRTIDVGYTYIGQFIAHDITEPAHARNNHHPTAALDLDSLYGTAAPAVIDASGRFEIGRGEGNIPDLLREASGQARIPDLRNDENIIVSQLHLFWQRFHNFLLDEGLAQNFDAARELTIKAFLLVVVEDYLQLLLAPKVFEQYFRRGERHWLNLPSSPVPLLFSKAAFRFGHSMVRDFYEVAGGPRNTDLLFRADRPLTGEFHIAWRHFFGWPDQPTGVPDALAIDTLITPKMALIPFPPGQQTNIVEKNILASETLQHTGVQLLEHFLMQNPELASVFDLAPQTQLSPDLKNLKGVAVAEFPLWPYILNEAAVETGGARLGTFGSLICAEVLANSIEAAGLLSWPLQLADALASLGPLGARIQQVAAMHGRPLPSQNSPAENGIGRRFCMRHLIELLEPTAAKTKEMTTMADSTQHYPRLPDDEIPPEFLPWVATSQHAATEVTDPCYIDHRAVEDLYFYHPGFRGSLPQLFKHVAAVDPNTGEPWIVVDALSNNWDEKMAEVMWALKFRPSTDPNPILVAHGIDEAGTRDMHGWLVKGWKVATGRDTHGDKVHQDLIEWTKTVNGQPLRVISIFSWRPYAPVHERADVAPALRLHERGRSRTVVR